MGPIWEVVRVQSGVQRYLTACGFLKFFDYPLIRSHEFLLQYLIGMWSTDLQCFIVIGEQLTFSTTKDVYFLTVLPFCGMALPIDPKLPGEDRVGDLEACHCTRMNPMSGLVIRIEAIDDLLMECIVAMVVRIYGSLRTKRITGGQLRIVEQVLDGDPFAWVVLLHTKRMRQVNRCRRYDSGDFAFGSVLVAWFLERVPLLRPRILLDPMGQREPQLMRWGHVLDRHGGRDGSHYFTTTVARVWRQMPEVILRYPYAGMDYRHDPNMMFPPRED
jgi:hypothetical protein